MQTGLLSALNDMNRFCDYDAIIHYEAGTFASQFADKLEGKVEVTSKEDLTQEEKESFLNGQYDTFFTTQPITAYRLYGKYTIEDQLQAKSGSRLGGRYVSTEFAESIIDAKMRLALDPSWKNTKMYEAKLIIPPGTTICVGVVAPVILPTGAILPGGAPQIMLPINWSEEWVCGYRRVSGRQIQTEPTYWPQKPEETVHGKHALYPDICPRCCFDRVQILLPHEQIQIIGSKGHRYTLKKKCMNPGCQYYW